MKRRMTTKDYRDLILWLEFNMHQDEIKAALKDFEDEKGYKFEFTGFKRNHYGCFNYPNCEEQGCGEH